MNLLKQKLVFDVEGNRELAEAIKARLETLGGIDACCQWTDGLTKAVLFNHGSHGFNAILFTGTSPDKFPCSEYRLATIDDLYDLENCMKSRYLVLSEESDERVEWTNDLAEARRSAERMISSDGYREVHVLQLVGTVTAETTVKWDDQ